MPTYVLLARWTQEGVRRFKQSPERVEEAKQSWKDLGAEMKAFYFMFGYFDFLIIFDAPDDKTAARVAISQSAKGAVRTELHPAFSEDEYRVILAGFG